ncbi:MAG TPA: S8 family serine peptidase [Gaiellaceae bacterium]|nr:S8 family serine peptidase [Gaiellaceae bacterium]
MGLRTIGGGSGGGFRLDGPWTARPGVRHSLLALLVLALAAPLTAAAGGGSHASRQSYLAPSLGRAADRTPDASVSVIVRSDAGTGSAHSALDRYGETSELLDVVGGVAGQIRAGDLPRLAAEPGLAITPDTSVVLDHTTFKDSGAGSGELWPRAVGVDQLWPPTSSTSAAPTIAFVDSGIDSSRRDFGDRVLAAVDLTSLPHNSRGDGYGHGTMVAGLAAGSAPRYTGAAPSAGIVSLDVMDDQGMARTSDVIRAAQWILRNKDRYGIRVANFSLHSSTASSFRWDPLDKAVEKLWFSGVVVVTSAGNDGKSSRRPVRMGFAPANDPFVITVGALDLHGSTSPDRADVPSWSSWGYTYDGFAKPELAAPGRGITGPVPSNSTLARRGHLTRTSSGTYATLSGTSLAAPIVSGIAADLLALNPRLSPDCVKGSLMLGAQDLSRVRSLAAGVGEVYGPAAASAHKAPNPNLALDSFLVADPSGPGLVFDDEAWLEAAQASPVWDAVSWSDGWAGTSWSLVSWSDVSWSDVSWSDVSWSDVSWSDVSWSDLLPDDDG